MDWRWNEITIIAARNSYQACMKFLPAVSGLHEIPSTPAARNSYRVSGGLHGIPTGLRLKKSCQTT